MLTLPLTTFNRVQCCNLDLPSRQAVALQNFATMKWMIISLLMLIHFNGLTQKSFLFIGTYTGSGSKGIYVYEFDPATGRLKHLSNTDSVINPSYLQPSRDGRFLYAVNETHGNNPGKVSAFAFNRQTGRLSLLNQQFTGGDDPCYITVDSKRRWVLVGNYSGGSVAVLPLAANGSLKPASQLIQHSGNSVHADRQEKPHVHATVFSPDEQFVFTPDLGTDKVMVYRFNPGSSFPLSPASPSFAAAEAGSGPRHIVFHPNKQWAYLTEELSGTVSAFTYNNGKLSPIQRINTHDSSYSGAISGADIHVSPDGKFLYSSNRGDQNSIAIFSIQPVSGRLRLLGYQPTGGITPRNFTIDPSGNYLLVANQDSDNIVVFRRHPNTGMLTATGQELSISKPVCLQMMTR